MGSRYQRSSWDQRVTLCLCREGEPWLKEKNCIASSSVIGKELPIPSKHGRQVNVKTGQESGLAPHGTCGMWRRVLWNRFPSNPQSQPRAESLDVKRPSRSPVCASAGECWGHTYTPRHALRHCWHPRCCSHPAELLDPGKGRRARGLGRAGEALTPAISECLPAACCFHPFPGRRGTDDGPFAEFGTRCPFICCKAGRPYPPLTWSSSSNLVKRYCPDAAVTRASQPDHTESFVLAGAGF